MQAQKNAPSVTASNRKTGREQHKKKKQRAHKKNQGNKIVGQGLFLKEDELRSRIGAKAIDKL
jgi:hypothetical protein